MSRILILNGNPLDLIAKGHPDYGAVFADLFAGLAPGTKCTILNPNHEAIPDSAFDDVDGVVFTGSSTHYAADASEAAPHRVVMERAFANGLPVWGSCNGLQLAAVVLGGRIGASPKGVEIGLGKSLTLTEAGQRHAMMAGRPNVFTACEIHRDEVQRLPDGALLLASNDHSPVQAMAMETGGVRFWGTQYHPEVVPGMIADALRRRDENGPLAADLEAAPTDAAAAARLGTTCADLRPEVLATELRNWLGLVSAGR